MLPSPASYVPYPPLFSNGGHGDVAAAGICRQIINVPIGSPLFPVATFDYVKFPALNAI